jgi:hypothetical protein
MKNGTRNVALTVALLSVQGCSSGSNKETATGSPEAGQEAGQQGGDDGGGQEAGQGTPTTLTTAPDKTPLTMAAKNQLWFCPRPGLSPTLTASSTPWVSGTTIDLTKVAYVQGAVTWQSQFNMSITSAGRVITGNGLPNHPTGQFPVDSSTAAYAYYSQLPAQGYSSAAAIPIAAYDINLTLPVNPTPNATPTCVNSIFMGVVSQTGGAWHAEIAPDSQLKLHDPLTALPLDQCFGHPYNTQYHYHAYSWKCFPNQGDPGQHSPLFGYAIDGFGVYGPRGENGQVVTNADLDECHGHTHPIEWDGATVTMYHYHLNTEYPYSIGCYRGTPVTLPSNLQE